MEDRNLDRKDGVVVHEVDPMVLHHVLVVVKEELPQVVLQVDPMVLHHVGEEVLPLWNKID